MVESTLSWTKYAPLEDETSILDPLAFDYFAQVLGNVVLPSFTTRTSRARYYSMVCYGLDISKKYLELNGKPPFERDILEVFRLYEKFWARAIIEFYGGKLSERDGKENGFRGKRGAITAYNNNIMVLGNEYKLLARQLELGGLGAYRTSMESLELIDAYLNLTHKGLKLVKAFVDNSTNNKIVLKALDSQKVILKEGKASIASFGYHTCLDGFTFKNYPHEEERNSLREYILNDPKNYTSVSYIYYNYDKENHNPMITIEKIANSNTSSDVDKRVIEAFKTIHAFEILAIAINKIWCEIIKATEDNIGRISITECSERIRPFIDIVFNDKLIGQLISKQNYYDIIESYHGTSFNSFLAQFSNWDKLNYESFIIEIIRYHTSIMNRRNSGAWIILDETDIIVLSGYDYSKKSSNLKYLHSYKIQNIMSLIEDTGWSPDA